ncbi:hypothetical protein [Mesorhizobium sp. A623]
MTAMHPGRASPFGGKSLAFGSEKCSLFQAANLAANLAAALTRRFN